jgi:hypothetical protein
MSTFEADEHLRAPADAKFGGERQHAEGFKGTEQKLRPVTQCSSVHYTSERERKKHIGGANADRRRNHAYKNQRVALQPLPSHRRGYWCESSTAHH